MTTTTDTRSTIRSATAHRFVLRSLGAGTVLVAVAVAVAVGVATAPSASAADRQVINPCPSCWIVN